MTDESVERCDIAANDEVRIQDAGARRFRVSGVWWDRSSRRWMLRIATTAFGIHWHATVHRNQVQKL